MENWQIEYEKQEKRAKARAKKEMAVLIENGLLDTVAEYAGIMYSAYFRGELASEAFFSEGNLDEDFPGAEKRTRSWENDEYAALRIVISRGKAVIERGYYMDDLRTLYGGDALDFKNDVLSVYQSNPIQVILDCIRERMESWAIDDYCPLLDD